MALENTDIDKITILARLQVTPSETSDYANSISSILSLIDQMQQVSTEGIAVSYTHLTLPTNREV